MIVEKQTPLYEIQSIAAGATYQWDLVNAQSVSIFIRNGGGVAGTVSIFGMSPAGAVLWQIANVVAVAVGANMGVQLSANPSYAAAAPDAAAGAVSAFLALPPSIQINAAGSQMTCHVVIRER